MCAIRAKPSSFVDLTMKCVVLHVQSVLFSTNKKPVHSASSPDSAVRAEFTSSPFDGLASSGQSTITSGSVVEVELGLAAASETGENLAASLVPLGQLDGDDACIAGVEALDKVRLAGIRAANVEGPADQGTVLIGI